MEHGEACNARVYCQEDIVCNDKCLEPAVAGNPPRLVAMLTIVPIEVGDGDGVDGGDCQWHLGVKRLLEDVLRNLEWVREGRFAAVGVRDGRRCDIRGKFEDGPCRDLPRKERGACARHCDVAA